MGPKTTDISVFGPEFQNIIVIFDISTLKFVELQNFTKKEKCLNCGPKMPSFGTFKLEISKKNVIFEVSTVKLVELRTFAKKE